jgi:dTDP-4-amino-4,6-dideoxygalactose transaminase
VGSSFLPSEVTAAFLFAQLEELSTIQARRVAIWNQYYEGLKGIDMQLPVIPTGATNNAHAFYLVTDTPEQRDELIAHLKAQGIWAVFHYLSLHASPYYKDKHDERVLPWSDYYSERLVRLPMYYDLTDEEVMFTLNQMIAFS